MPRKFVDNCDRTFNECNKILGDRGGQYDVNSDTWDEENFKAPCLEMVFRLLGLPQQSTLALRTIQGAAHVDQKMQRIVGDYKQDTFVDLINYAANLDADVQAIKKCQKEIGDYMSDAPGARSLPAGTEIPMGVTAADIQKLKQEDWRDSSEAPLFVSFAVKTDGEIGRGIKIRQDGEHSQWEGSYDDGSEVFEPEYYDANSGRAIGEKQ